MSDQFVIDRVFYPEDEDNLSQALKNTVLPEGWEPFGITYENFRGMSKIVKKS